MFQKVEEPIVFISEDTIRSFLCFVHLLITL